jgi:hypothetical protein
VVLSSLERKLMKSIKITISLAIIDLLLTFAYIVYDLNKFKVTGDFVLFGIHLSVSVFLGILMLKEAIYKLKCPPLAQRY